ncbi:MAG: ATPase [Oscillospiraceae bacterium]|nr:ATPase [Oscillospiraceae bacterium]
MKIEEVLDMLDELLDQSWSLPLSGGRCVVDAEKVRDLIDDIRINMPGEITMATEIVKDRAEIIEGAKREAEGIVRKAEERAKALVAKEEIIKISQGKASEILSQTQMQAREMRAGAQTFTDDILRTTEESLTKALTEVKSARHAMRGKAKK